MRIKELEKLHPAAFQLAKEETIHVFRFSFCYDINDSLALLFEWDKSSQKNDVWEEIYANGSFDLMNEWIRANRPDLIDLIPKEDENKDK